MKLYPADMIEHIKAVNGGRIILNRKQVQEILDLNPEFDDRTVHFNDDFFIVSRAIHPRLGILVDVAMIEDYWESVRVPLSEIAQLPGDLYETIDI